MRIVGVKIAEFKDPVLFKQEYPATAAEAFQMSGHDSYIPPALVASMIAWVNGASPIAGSLFRSISVRRRLSPRRLMSVGGPAVVRSIAVPKCG